MIRGKKNLEVGKKPVPDSDASGDSAVPPLPILLARIRSKRDAHGGRTTSNLCREEIAGLEQALEQGIVEIDWDSGRLIVPKLYDPSGKGYLLFDEDWYFHPRSFPELLMEVVAVTTLHNDYGWPLNLLKM